MRKVLKDIYNFKKWMLVSLLVMVISFTYSQDPQFSQYYAAPLLLNPAMAGGTDCYRAGLNARTQWTGLPGGAFNTVSFFADLNYPDLRSGFGLMALHDRIGTPRMSSTEISGFYSFLVPVSDLVNFRMGLQGTYASRGLNYDRLIFEDQYRGITVVNPSSSDPVTNYDNVNYGDISTGIMMFDEDHYWVGFSAHHLTEPQQGFYENSILPIKYSLHGGFNFYKKKSNLYGRRPIDKRIIPTFMYKAQSRFDQLDLGVYFINAPFLAGIWYRGIPVKRDYVIFNKDAINIQLGFQHNDFSFTYSYDFTISRLNMINTHGSHEISLIYLFCLDWPKRKKPARHARKPLCPDFQRSLRYKGNF